MKRIQVKCNRIHIFYIRRVGFNRDPCHQGNSFTDCHYRVTKALQPVQGKVTVPGWIIGGAKYKGLFFPVHFIKLNGKSQNRRYCAAGTLARISTNAFSSCGNLNRKPDSSIFAGMTQRLFSTNSVSVPITGAPNFKSHS